ncbi:MAG TPA: peptidase S8 [Crocinitomix sp.]|nr:peptidase S8 [Crocinitomix sp.]
MKSLKNVLIFTFMVILSNAYAQEVNKKILNWYNGKKYGMSTDKAYKKVLADKKATKVIVAVIDSGVDIEHEDLKDIIWTNTDEIPNNGIDDDNNGYIDDVHGWNFLGNADGENLNDVQLEMTRIYQKFDSIFKGKSYADLSDEEKKDYDLYKEVREKVKENREKAEKSVKQMENLYESFSEADTRLKKHFGGEYTAKDLKKVKKDPELSDDARMMNNLFKAGYTVEDFEDIVKYYQSQFDYHYNPEIYPRKLIGDNPDDFTDTDYGNNDVEGPDAMHGTHCSGIIAAIRNNGIGNNGVADNVLIMSIRAVPNGDERDKDIALAIRYAVDNGAQVCNMSFGKAYSLQSEEVIKAIRYAEEHGVLLVHAAGNSGMDIDDQEANPNFPSPKFPSMSKRFTNWIEVGASTRYKKHLAASFSNYGDETVDIFAPGLEIWSTVPQSEYEISQGTSMAAPMVTGLAALLKAYYPELTMFQIKDIILKSGQDVSDKLLPIPGGKTKVTMGELSITGKIANVYNAVLMAEEMTSKK